jgi:hypothetical protein
MEINYTDYPVDFEKKEKAIMSDYVFQLVQMREKIQKERKAFGNRLGAFERGDDEPAKGEKNVIERYFDKFQELENDVDSEIAEFIEHHKIYPYLTGVKGIGPSMAAQIVSQIDIRKADTVSALWRYAGYGVVDGKAERPTKGEKLHYNKNLKTVFYKVASQLLRANSPYRRFYDSAKEYYQVNRPDWTKLHIHMASLRKMIKMFISHLWHVWREIEGLETREMYVQEKLGHDHIIPPDEFGWYDWIKD